MGVTKTTIARGKPFSFTFLLAVSLLGDLGQATWPGCVETGKDYDAFDLIAGLRFSSEGCAFWCKNLGSCNFWVCLWYTFSGLYKSFKGYRSTDLLIASVEQYTRPSSLLHLKHEDHRSSQSFMFSN